MKKKSLIVATLLTLSMFGVAQNKTVDNKKSEANIYTSIKPADATPYTFGTQAEMDAKQQNKKGVILSEIKANANKPEKLKTLREELWRVENAVIINSSTK